MLSDSADLVQREHANEPSTEVSVDPEKTYELPELIDIAQRTNPETRVAWERARQAAIAVGLAEGTYYPLLAATATGGAAHLAMPFPANVFPGGLPNGYLTTNAQFVLPIVSLEWWLLDFGRRASAVDAAKALKLEATVGSTPSTSRSCSRSRRRSMRSPRSAGGSPRRARRSIRRRHWKTAAEARRAHGEGTLPEALQAHEEVARAQYEVDDALAAEIDARMALAESMGVLPTTPIRVVDVSQQPLPPGAEESVDDAVDRALAQRVPDLLARLATLREKEAEVRHARAEYFPKVGVRAATGRNIWADRLRGRSSLGSTRSSGTPGSASSGRCSRASSGATG